MKRVTDWMYHALSGNDTGVEQTVLTRALLAAALMELATFSGDLMGTDFAGRLPTTIIVVSFVLYGVWDKWLKNTGRKP